MSAPNQLHWWSSPRTALRHLLMLDDTAHSVALGTAVGVFLGMTPTVGIQMVLVVVISLLTRRIARFNRIAAFIAVYISNPVTIVPIYWFDYKVGTLFLGGNVSRQEFVRMLQFDGFAEWWSTMTTLFADVGAPLFLGSLFVATFAGAVTYPVMRGLLKSFRSLKPAKRETKPPPVASSVD